jgi:tRNA (mo5U34)-methyltransferase
VDLLDAARWDWPAGSEAETRDAIGERKGRGEGFEIVMDALGHDITRLERSVYELDPDEIGRFDFVYLGSLLLHLRDPIGALERVRSVCSGRLVAVDAIDPVLSRLHPRRPLASFDGLGRPWWWKPNVAGLVRMVRSAGFEPTEPPRRVQMKPGEGFARPALTLSTIKALRSGRVRAEMRNVLVGDPHAAVYARPRLP